MSQTQTRRSSQVDLLHGSILKSLLLFALPIMASRVFQQIYNTMDTLIVGYTLGDSSIAAMGACSSIYEMMTGFTFGVGNGLAIVTARCFGRQETDRMKKSVASCIVIGVAVTLVVTILATIFMHPLLRLLKTPAKILEESYSYISILSIFLFVMFAYNLCSGLLRAIGNSFMPLVFLIFSSLVNIVLDLLFIRTFGMGVRGAAIATVIAQGISVVLCLINADTMKEIADPIAGESFSMEDKTLLIDQKELYDLSGNLLYTVEDGKKGELVSDGILQVTYSEEEKETVDGESEYVEVDKTDYYDLKGKKLFSEMDTADSKMVLEPSEEV